MFCPEFEESQHLWNGRKLLFQFCAGIFEQSVWAWNRVEIELAYRPARLHSLAELVPLEPILVLLKSLKIRALDS